jgi:hypothetical protein
MWESQTFLKKMEEAIQRNAGNKSACHVYESASNLE